MARSIDKNNQALLCRLLLVVVVMFCFGFALVPFYKKICEAVGLNSIERADDVANTQIDTARTVTIEFDANLRGLPWEFRPLATRMRVHPGELAQVRYEVVNTTGRAMEGQAIPSYGPLLAAQYFKKLQCFCFTQQTLQAHETRQMPVVFVIDPALPRDVNTITLSYTFFSLRVAGTAGAGS
jgi:cytochrome c oxidase assembly protein subunit 11